ncbi:MAG: diacylglycerol kinase family protein [Verrucomicrobia bacterium]|nr:diacylglycerol kinase family protein [Verrucomicrobiota bacterium]
MITNYLAARIRSFGYAFRGLWLMILTQPHPQLHALATIAVLIAGIVLHLRRWEWVAILLCIGMVWVAEALNSALEFLADEVSLEKRERIGKAKDVAAGGVLIAAIVSAAVAALVFWNHLR